MNYNELREPLTPAGQNQKIFVNLTTRYLLPQIKLFPEEMLSMMDSTNWSAFGIADRNLPKDFPQYTEFDNKLFCLAHTSGDVQYWMQNHEFYLYLDGEADKIMVVLDLPINNRNDFLQGNYSQLYDNETIEHIIPKVITKNNVDYLTSAYRVLTKDPSAREEFEEKLNKDFNLKPRFTVPEEQEYEYIPNMSREIFNYERVQTNNLLLSV